MDNTCLILDFLNKRADDSKPEAGSGTLFDEGEIPFIVFDDAGFAYFPYGTEKLSA